MEARWGPVRLSKLPFRSSTGYPVSEKSGLFHMIVDHVGWKPVGSQLPKSFFLVTLDIRQLTNPIIRQLSIVLVAPDIQFQQIRFISYDC